MACRLQSAVRRSRDWVILAEKACCTTRRQGKFQAVKWLLGAGAEAWRHDAMLGEVYVRSRCEEVGVQEPVR